MTIDEVILPTSPDVSTRTSSNNIETPIIGITNVRTEERGIGFEQMTKRE